MKRLRSRTLITLILTAALAAGMVQIGRAHV